MKPVKFLTFLFLIVANCAFANNKNLNFWMDRESDLLLAQSQFKNDFTQLVNFYQPQINPLYCGVASSVIVMNALQYSDIPNQSQLSVAKPNEMGGGIIEYHLYSQLSFLNDKTDSIKKRSVIDLKQEKTIINGKKIYDPGLSMNDLAQILSRVYRFKVVVNNVVKSDADDLENFRSTIKNYLSENKFFVIVNFNAAMLGLGNLGHFSPIGAYDEKSDKILVMDVALHKNKWFWVDLKSLHMAMNTKDGNEFRGFLVISK